MDFPGGMEWFIALVIALLIFGGGKLAGVDKSLEATLTELQQTMRTEEVDFTLLSLSVMLFLLLLLLAIQGL